MAGRSFFQELYLGRLRWDMIAPFPVPDDEDVRRGDETIAELTNLLRAEVDPDEVDLTRRLPDGLVDALNKGGYLKLRVDEELGGLGLSAHGAFRVFEAAAGWCVPAAVIMTVHNGFGVNAYLPAVPNGPLRDFMRAQIAAGSVSGSADSEPTGAANLGRTTTATPIRDRAAYVLNGEKLFVSNGSIGDLMTVSATITEDGQDSIGIFFVDTQSSGFHVESDHEYMGLRGLPNSRLRLENVEVPIERMLITHSGEWRLTSPLLAEINTMTRLYTTTAPASAVAKRCLEWSREFVSRRSVDGRNLGSYDEIQRMIATSVGETFAIDSVLDWCLLDEQSVDRQPDRMAAKNICTVTGWRIVNRTMSLLGAEGFETARSKARRGIPPHPVERAFRDLRGMLTAGGVEFFVYYRAARFGILPSYYPRPVNADEIEGPPPDLTGLTNATLLPRNRDHLLFVAIAARAYARTCLRLSREHPDPADLYTRQHLLILLGQLADELFTMSVVLARAARMTEQGIAAAQTIADTYCTAARRRIDGWWRELDEEPSPDFADLSCGWLRGDAETAAIRGL